MATVEEVMAQALATEQLAEEEWTKVYSYKIKAQYTDTDVAVDVRKREIGDVRENVSTIDENNAQYISFIMDRYCDGVDLTGMRIQIQYQVSEGVGSTNAPVNVCYNSSQIRFGWIVPKAATQTNEIKVIVACVGKLADGSTYELKTKPVVYNIADTLRLGSDVPQPDENWYLQFVTVMDEKVANALKSANDAAQSAMQANESLSAVQQVQADVDASKETVQTLAQQVQDNTAKSQNSADAAKASEETARSWAERAQELSGVSYASKELAGIVAPQDVYVNPENGHMNLITRTTDKTLTNSYSGGIKINKVYGRSEQNQYSGYNLLDFSNAKGGSNVGVTVTINADGSYSYVGTPTETNVNVWFLGNYVGTTPILTLAPGKYYVKGVNLYYNSTNIFTGGRNGGFITLTEDTPIAGIRAVSGEVGTSYNETWYPIIAKSDVEVPWEPYVGGIPSPNPDYPQEIKSVVNPVVTLSDGENSQTVTLPYTLRGIGDVKDRIIQKDGVWGVERKIARIESYNGESVTTEYMSTTGGIDTGATVDYVLSTPTFESLSESDQLALHTLKSFDTVTCISTDSEIEPAIDLEYGTSRVGALALDAWNTAQRNEIRISALETAQEIATEEEAVKE